MVVTFVLLVVFLLVILLLLFYKFVFLRDPKRRIPSGDDIVSPADGRIIKIVKLGELDKLKIRKGLIGKIKTLVLDNCKGGYLITIMMDLFDVHVQRAPVEGVVVSIKHVSGGFRNAVYGNKFENGIYNEKNEIVIDNSKIGKIKMIQIAGVLARRIECFVKEKQKINKGERVGRIVMGSQVSLILPRKVRLMVKEGNKVKAGESIIASY